MHRVILQLPFFTIYSWGVMTTLGFGIATLYFLTLTKRDRLSQYFMLNLVIGIILFAIVGARVFYILIHLHYYILHPIEIFQSWKGGMVFYGGLFFALTFSILYIKIHNLYLGKVADCAAPAIAFGLSVGRIGCFLNGCCYGIPSNFGFIFPLDSPAGEAFPHQTLFPTQLTSSFNLFLLGLTLHLFKKRSIAKHKLLILFLLLYSVHRFFVEFLRADTHPLVSNLTLFQIMSIVLVVFSLVWWKIEFFITEKKVK